LFLNKISLKLEHFPQKSPLEFPDEKMHMEVFDTPIRHALASKGEVLIFSERFSHEIIYEWELEEFFLREFV
jgi:hypothetical protein